MNLLHSGILFPE